MLTRLALSLVLLAAACTASGNAGQAKGAEAGAPAKGETDVKAEVIAKPSEKVETAPPTTAGLGKLDAPPDDPGKLDAPVGGKAKIRVKVGETLVETVSNVRNPVDGSSWSAEPKIEGTAVRFIGRDVEGPPPDVDGGSNTFRYRFEAVAPGTAKVSFALTSPAQPEPLEAVRFTVVVSAG